MKRAVSELFSPISFILVTTLFRIIPHPANFTPIAALALFGGVYLSRRLAIIIPLAAMVLSDLFIGFDSFEMRLTVYGSFLLIGFIGIYLKNRKSVGNILLAALFSSLLFFIITNSAVWIFWDFYPKTLSGLMSCYVSAIPFFRNTLIGDLFYVTLFFGSYESVMLSPKILRLVALDTRQ